MEITGIETQKKDDSRCSVFIDGHFAFGLSLFDCKSLGLKPGLTLTEEAYDHILDTILFEQAKNTALKFLTHKTRTKKEISDKLKEKEFPALTIEKTIDLLEKYHYLDDLKYAGMYIQDAVKLKRLGRHRIIYDLKRKGVSGQTIDAAFGELDITGTEQEQAFELLQKKCRYTPLDMKEKNRLYQMLIRKGYSHDIIGEAFKKLNAEPEDFFEYD